MTTDCKGFLKTYPNHTIIDEAQRVPSFFSYLQTHVDLAGEKGMYVLTGSQNLNMGDDNCLEIPFIVLSQKGMYRTDRVVVIKK